VIADSTGTVEAWAAARGFAALHACESITELERRFASDLKSLLPDTPLVLGLVETGGRHRVAVSLGTHGIGVGDMVAASGPDWSRERLPIRFRNHELGALCAGRSLRPDEIAIATAALVHFGTAIGNLTLNEESRQATAAYCASVQTLEEGIILFQEGDSEAVQARLLSLATSLAQTNAGALYVLREVGDASSGLQLEQTLGIPDSLLATFRSADGSAWPDSLLGQSAQLLTRSDDGALAGLAGDCVPPALRNVVVLPLRYHGVEAGVCLLFNAGFEAANAAELVARVQSLGQLGAALLHRLRLEALTARNRSIERELQIAATIQKRLLPTTAPATREFAFAWSSIAAQSIGGDYLDVFGQDDGALNAIIADASGHGINSAMLMSSFRSTYRANASRHTVATLTASLNNEIVNEVGPTGMFITAALLRLDRAERRVTVTSAGHTPVMILRAATGAVEMLASDGPPLGFLQGAEFTDQVLHLESGDSLLLYTDGVTEATNVDLDMFGEERLARLLKRHAADDPQVLLNAVRRDLAEFTKRDRYDDDVSMLVIRVR